MQLTGLATALLAYGVVTVIASPIFPPTNAFTVQYIDKFDNRTVSPVTIGPVSSVGIYGALNYSGFSISGDETSIVRKPPSEPNFIYGSIVGSKPLQLLPANSSVLFFNLESLYYACSPSLGGAVGASQSCTILLSGRKAPQLGGTTVVRTLVFDSTSLSDSYIQALLPPSDFSGLVQASINVIGAEVTTTTATVNFDNIAYTATFSRG